MLPSWVKAIYARHFSLNMAHACFKLFFTLTLKWAKGPLWSSVTMVNHTAVAAELSGEDGHAGGHGGHGGHGESAASAVSFISVLCVGGVMGVGWGGMGL